MSFLKKAGGIIGGGVGFLVGGPAGAAAGFSIGGAVSGALGERDARRAEKRAAQEQRRLALLNAQRQRLELLRDVQSARAAAMASNIQAGVGMGSSPMQGVHESLLAATHGDIAFQREGGDIASAIWRQTGRAASARGAGALGSAIGQIGADIMGMVPRRDPVQTVPQTTGTGANIQGTGTSVYNPETGRFEMPRGFDDDSLFGR